MSRYKSLRGAGIATIEIDDTALQQSMEELLREIVPDTYGALQTATTTIAQKSRGKWPIGKKRENRSFHSIEKFSVSVSLQGEAVVAKVSNEAFWAGLIKRKGVGAVFDIAAEERKARGIKDLRNNKLIWKATMAYFTEVQMGKTLDLIMRELGL